MRACPKPVRKVRDGQPVKKETYLPHFPVDTHAVWKKQTCMTLKLSSAGLETAPALLGRRKHQTEMHTVGVKDGLR